MSSLEIDGRGSAGVSTCVSRCPLVQCCSSPEASTGGPRGRSRGLRADERSHPLLATLLLIGGSVRGPRRWTSSRRMLQVVATGDSTVAAGRQPLELPATTAKERLRAREQRFSRQHRHMFESTSKVRAPSPSRSSAGRACDGPCFSSSLALARALPVVLMSTWVGH